MEFLPHRSGRSKTSVREMSRRSSPDFLFCLEAGQSRRLRHRTVQVRGNPVGLYSDFMLKAVLAGRAQYADRVFMQ